MSGIKIEMNIHLYDRRDLKTYDIPVWQLTLQMLTSRTGTPFMVPTYSQTGEIFGVFANLDVMHRIRPCMSVTLPCPG